MVWRWFERQTLLRRQPENFPAVTGWLQFQNGMGTKSALRRRWRFAISLCPEEKLPGEDFLCGDPRLFRCDRGSRGSVAERAAIAKGINSSRTKEFLPKFAHRKTRDEESVRKKLLYGLWKILSPYSDCCRSSRRRVIFRGSTAFLRGNEFPWH
jgi:hypothetical protein